MFLFADTIDFHFRELKKFVTRNNLKTNIAPSTGVLACHVHSLVRGSRSFKKSA